MQHSLRICRTPYQEPDSLVVPRGFPSEHPQRANWIHTNVTPECYEKFDYWFTEANSFEDGNVSGVWADWLRDNPEAVENREAYDLLLNFLDAAFAAGCSNNTF